MLVVDFIGHPFTSKRSFQRPMYPPIHACTIVGEAAWDQSDVEPGDLGPPALAKPTIVLGVTYPLPGFDRLERTIKNHGLCALARDRVVQI
jgi:hypothetical protein